ncbi:MAG: hypothetical protein HQK86_10155 [Nitrospinae bacterium]|nr:hypothetical protein [Nitrospinota bacterium]MBF0633714.1 hypothetical protein [Nitrospinota bacterium]
MPLKTLIFMLVAGASLSLSGCAAFNPLLVTMGLAEAPPPVTDSNYFNMQTDLLLERIKTSQSKTLRRVATLNFINANGQVSELGKYLTSKFVERAMASQMFRMTPQGQVKEAMTKLKIVGAAELTRDQIEKLGTELDVDAIVTGVVSDLQKGSDVDVSVKVIHVQTGGMVAAASVNIYRSKQVQTLIQQF